jgi:hypothetical protein
MRLSDLSRVTAQVMSRTNVLSPVCAQKGKTLLERERKPIRNRNISSHFVSDITPTRVSGLKKTK